MDAPRISWRLLEEVDGTDDEFEFVQRKTYTEEGSFIPGDYIIKTMQVWNNHLGTEDVQDATQCSLVISFKNFENNFLINLMEIEVDGVKKQIELDVDGGVVSIGDLSGIANTGTSSHELNYKTIKFTLGPIPDNIKSELKSMYFYLEYTGK